MGKYTWNASDIDWIERVPGYWYRTLGSHEKLAVIEVRALAGFEVGLHEHDAEEAGYVLKGRGETQIGDEKAVLGPGDYFFFPSNTPHALRVLEDLEFIGAISPPRPEYKPKTS